MRIPFPLNHDHAIESLVAAASILDMSESRKDPTIALEFLHRGGWPGSTLSASLESNSPQDQRVALEGVLSTLNEVFKKLTGQYQADIRRIRSAIDKDVSDHNSYLLVDPDEVREDIAACIDRADSLSDSSVAAICKRDWYRYLDEDDDSDCAMLINVKGIPALLGEMEHITERVRAMCDIASPLDSDTISAYEKKLGSVTWYPKIPRYRGRLLGPVLSLSGSSLLSNGINSKASFKQALDQLQSKIVDTRPAVKILHDRVISILSDIDKSADSDIRKKINRLSMTHQLCKRGAFMISDVCLAYDSRSGVPLHINYMMSVIKDHL